MVTLQTQKLLLLIRLEMVVLELLLQQTVRGAVTGGDLERFSGDIIYVENRSPISRATDQIEDIKLIIEF